MARIMIKLSVLFEFLLPLRSCWSSSEQDIDQIVFGSHKTIRSRRMYGGEKANRKSATKFAEGPFWTDLKSTIAGYRFLNFFSLFLFFSWKDVCMGEALYCAVSLEEQICHTNCSSFKKKKKKELSKAGKLAARKGLIIQNSPILVEQKCLNIFTRKSISYTLWTLHTVCFEKIRIV